jgi:hypothetical protein
MNKILKVFLGIMLAYSCNAYAQTTADTIEEPEKDMIPITVERDKSNGEIESRLADLQPTGIELGIGAMVIEGEKTETLQPDGTTKIDIVWTGAYLVKEDGEKKSTDFGEPLESIVAVKDTLVKGDKFTAEGSSMEILLAWERLNAEEEVVEEEVVEEQLVADEATANNGGGAGASETDPRTADFVAPEFAEVIEPLITTTTEGCNMNVDISQMVAIVQERTLEDGTEITPCEDTLTRYPLNAKYSSCALSFDMPNSVAYEQFTLSYADPVSGGDIQVQDCTADSEKIISLTEDTSGCGIRDDFTLNKSFQQAEISYIYNGETVVLSACSDTATSYDHVTVTDTAICPPVVTGTDVTFQERLKIVVNSSDVYITPCTPDASTTIAVLEEDCASPRYTHDFDTDQSFLNKNYYYMDGATRVDVSSCVQGVTTYVHKQDEALCTDTNDDTAKETTVRAKTYITDPDNGGDVIISSCGDVLPVVPYTKTTSIWRQTSQSSNATVTYTGTNGAQINSSLTSIYGCCIGGGFQYYNAWVGGAIPVGLQGQTATGVSWTPTYTRWLGNGATVMIKGARYCALNDNGGTYTIFGSSVDTSKNTMSPAISLSSVVVATNSITASCTATCSTSTAGELNPRYTRGDLTIYTDLATSEGTKTVCGTGANFVGTTQ